MGRVCTVAVLRRRIPPVSVAWRRRAARRKNTRQGDAGEVMTGTTQVERLGAFAANASFDQLSAAAIEALKLRVLDSLGTALGALDAKLVALVRRQVEDFGGAPHCSLIGGGRSAPDRAALLQRRAGALPRLQRLVPRAWRDLPPERQPGAGAGRVRVRARRTAAISSPRWRSPTRCSAACPRRRRCERGASTTSRRAPTRSPRACPGRSGSTPRGRPTRSRSPGRR